MPALDLIYAYGVLAGICIPNVQNDSTKRISLFARERNVSLQQVKSSELDSQGVEWLNQIKPDAAFLMTFPWKIPSQMLNIPPLGFINFHPGLLPEYRGIDPLFWQIKNGEDCGGITAFKMDNDFDTGEVILEEKVPILSTDTYGLHLNKLTMTAKKPMEIILKRLLASQPLTSTIQTGSNNRRSGRPDISQLTILWNRDKARDVDALVRAANPAYQGALCFIRNIPFRILETSVIKSEKKDLIAPGTVLTADSESGLSVQCAGEDSVRIHIIQSQDGLFTGERFCRIYGIQKGEILNPLPNNGEK